MKTLRHRAADRLLRRLARAIAAGSLLGVAGSSMSCGRAGPPATAERDTTAMPAVLQGEAVAHAVPVARADSAPPTVRSECTTCHDRAHQAVLGRGRAASTACTGCHGTVHDVIQDFYAGTARRIAVHPDPMYVARVACGGCHADSVAVPAAPAARLASLDRACTTCHGVKFAGMLPRWSAGLEWRTRAVTTYVNRAAADPRLNAPAKQRVRAAQQALAIVDEAGALHNVRGADAVLRRALDSTAAAYAASRLPPPERPAMGPDAATVTCVGCHYGIEASRDTVGGLAFDHGSHVVRGDVACKECHSVAGYIKPGTHEIDRRHGRTMVTRATCEGCHHASESATRSACSTCHAGDSRLATTIDVTLPLQLRPANAPHARVVKFQHLDHPNTACTLCHTTQGEVTKVATCASCHESHHREAGRCSSCHGADMHASHAAANHLTCSQCHSRETVAMLTPNRSFCVSCHADHADHKGGRECSTCHFQSTPSELRKRILGGRR